MAIAVSVTVIVLVLLVLLVVGIIGLYYLHRSQKVSYCISMHSI